MTILTQDPETGYWNKIASHGDATLLTHAPDQCGGRLCDVHNRRGEGEQSTWPLNWRSDRGIMEVICPCGIGHITPAQFQYLQAVLPALEVRVESVHGCCGLHCPIGSEQ